MDPRERRLVGHATYAHALNHAFLLLIPLLIPLWRAEFATDLYVLGLVAAVAYAFYGGGALPFGFLADRVGSRPLIALYLAGAAVALVLLSQSRSLLQLALGLALLGLFASPYHPSATAMITREVREQGRGLGYHGMGGSLGIALGPLAASLLLLTAEWRSVVLWFAAPAFLAAAAFALGAPRETAPLTRASPRRAVRTFLTADFVLVLLVYVFAGVAYWGALTFLPAYLDGLALPSFQVGPRSWTPGLYLFPALLTLGAVGQVAGGHLADRPRAEVSVGVASALVAVALLLLGLPTPLAVAILALAFGFLLFALEPLQNVLVAHRVPPDLRGLAFGLMFLAVFGVGSLGAALGGYVGETAGLALAFPLLAVFMWASGLAALQLRDRATA